MNILIPFPLDKRPTVDVSACLDGTRVWVHGRRFADFPTITAAARVASALMTLENYGLLDCIRSPSDVVRAGLIASVAEVEGGR